MILQLIDAGLIYIDILVLLVGFIFYISQFNRPNKTQAWPLYGSYKANEDKGIGLIHIF